jgi:hypothetical protein
MSAGVRAITMQQPYAAAMVANVGLYTRRGKAVAFDQAGGEAIAIHCGQNQEHLDNAAKMKKIRAIWPECPSDADLRSSQRCILGVAVFTESVAATAPPASVDPLLSMYDCSKPFAWSATHAVRLDAPVSYPSGQVQIWRIKDENFGGSAAEKAAGKALLTTAVRSAKSLGKAVAKVVKVKSEEIEAKTPAAAKKKPAFKAKVAAKKPRKATKK